MRLKDATDSKLLGDAIERIRGNKIILNGRGHFPKLVIIIEPRRHRRYELRKTSKGNYQLL